MVATPEAHCKGTEPRCYASHLARPCFGLEVPPNDVVDEMGIGEEMLEMPLVKYACIQSYIYFKLGMRFLNHDRDYNFSGNDFLMFSLMFFLT